MKITMYTKEDCPPCERVERILESEGYDLDINPEWPSREIGDILRDEGFPALFKGKEYLGSGVMAVHKIDPDINIAKYVQGE